MPIDTIQRIDRLENARHQIVREVVTFAVIPAIGQQHSRRAVGQIRSVTDDTLNVVVLGIFHAITLEQRAEGNFIRLSRTQFNGGFAFANLKRHDEDDGGNSDGFAILRGTVGVHILFLFVNCC